MPMVGTYCPLDFDLVILLFNLSLFLCPDYRTAERLGLFDFSVNACRDGINNCITLLLKISI